MNGSPSSILGAHELPTSPSIKCWVPAQLSIATFPKEELNSKWELGKAALFCSRAKFLPPVLCSWELARMPHDSDLLDWCMPLQLHTPAAPLKGTALLHKLKYTQDCAYCGVTCFCCSSSYFSVCLNHMFMETYTFLMEGPFFADLIDKVLVYFDVADLRHKVFKKVIYSMRIKSCCSCLNDIYAMIRE